ncbi:MAG: 4Fe-4S dicluster domain-containing protein [Thermoleophilia bacterium]
MIANYGYRDGSGEYYITIVTDRCIECEGRWCVAACPESLFEIETDDYDDEVAVIAEAARRLLKEKCSTCKPAGGYAELPCVAACRPGAVEHSW